MSVRHGWGLLYVGFTGGGYRREGEGGQANAGEPLGLLADDDTD
jgi:hypothetical protein